MQTKRQIQELLSSAGVTPNRRLGQHFLVDLNLMRLLANSAGVRPSDIALEIGTGTGSLTESLAERAGQVVGVELDPILAGIVRSRLSDVANVQVLNTDALSGKGALNPTVVEAITHAQKRLWEAGPPGPMAQPIPAAADPGRLVLVSNLPYDVASPVMINLVKGPVTAEAMSVTVQKEVADRMTAAPGGRHYGALSIFLSAAGRVEAIRILKPTVFWPPPQVDSAIVRYVRDEAKCRRIAHWGFFGNVVSLFIGHRRKMLRACIRHAGPEFGGRDVWLRIFEQHGIDPTRRPEELSAEQYVAMANSLSEYLRPR